jgi:hypothetical protein
MLQDAAKPEPEKIIIHEQKSEEKPIEDDYLLKSLRRIP